MTAEPKLPYFDYMASTPIANEVVNAMLPFLTSNYGNSSSKHQYGKASALAIAKAREQVAVAVGAQAKQITFTSGATEAINLAIKGVSHFYRKSGRHIITSNIEHIATLAVCRELEYLGYSVSYLKPDCKGYIAKEDVAAAMRNDTILVSLHHVNNEIGVVQDIAAIGDIVAANGALFHVDAAQSIGKEKLNLAEIAVDLASFSAHKAYGPQGIGALYIANSRRIKLSPQIHGGNQEYKLRAGTLATHQIVGMGVAFALSTKNFVTNIVTIRKLQQKLKTELLKLPGSILNSDEKSVPHNVNITFVGIDGASLFSQLSEKIAVSSGSACNAHEIQVSHVLLALGHNRAAANASIRFSIGNNTSEHDIIAAITATKTTVLHLIELAKQKDGNKKQ